MANEPLISLYSDDYIGQAIAETRSSALESSLNNGCVFNDSSLRKLEVSSYAAFKAALNNEGLEGFLRSRRYTDTENSSTADNFTLWSMAYDTLNTLIDAPNRTIDLELLLFFCSVAYAADKPNSATQILRKINIDDYEKSHESWDLLTINEISIALLSLIKQSKYADIEKAKEKINNLAASQRELENVWLENQPTRKAIYLLSLYHIAQATLRTAEFMASGKISGEERQSRNPEPELAQLLIKAEEFALQSGDIDNINFIQSVGIILWQLFSNSIWRHVGGISDELDGFIQSLHCDKRNKQIFSLLPSQQEAIKQAFFDPSKVGIVLEMPTSSGKTLLAELLIIQTLGENKTQSKVLYITPTRALASQVKRDLSEDLKGKGISVTSASNAFEEDPFELQILNEASGVVVATPEKTDLLMRVHPEWFENVKLVVVDEAHLLADGERGARLELLLANLRKDFVDIKYLLLTPFIENAKTISNWLGGDRAIPIHVSWRPTNIIVGIVDKRPSSIGKVDLWAKWREPHNIFNRTPNDTCLSTGVPRQEVSSIRKMVNHFSTQFSEHGSVLSMFPCSPHEAETAAYDFSRSISVIPRQMSSANLRAAIAIASMEYGENSRLAYCLKRGVAFHHGSISHELRYLVERLVSDGKIKNIFSTSTLAQGMNFPVSTVLIHSVHKPMGLGNLTSNEFWNIAGRAGRVGLSNKGIVLFANPAHDDHWKYYCSELSKPLDSALIKAIDVINDGGSLKDLYKRTPAIRPFIQYILHSCAVHGVSATRSQLAQLMEASLFNAQLPSVQAARKARHIASSYIDLLEGKPTSYLKLTDSTGLGSFSFDELRWKISQDTVLSAGPSNVYRNGPTGLASLIDALKWLPELDLSRELTSGSLNVDAISKMAWEWIQGGSIVSLSKYYPEDDDSERIRKTGSYVYGKLSHMLAWGSHAYLKALGLREMSKENIEDQMLPAYLQYGVNKPESVLASVFGLPRIIANAVGEEYQLNYGALSPEQAGHFRDLIESDSETFWSGVNKRSNLEDELNTGELIKLVRDIQGV